MWTCILACLLTVPSPCTDLIVLPGDHHDPLSQAPPNSDFQWRILSDALYSIINKKNRLLEARHWHRSTCGGTKTVVFVRESLPGLVFDFRLRHAYCNDVAVGWSQRQNVNGWYAGSNSEHVRLTAIFCSTLIPNPNLLDMFAGSSSYAIFPLYTQLHHSWWWSLPWM